MKTTIAVSVSIFAIGCASKQTTQSYVDGYSLTDEARIQLVGQYETAQTPDMELNICEANGSKGEVLYIEHNQSNTLQQMVVKLDSMKYDHTGHRSISLTGYSLKSPSNTEGLCASGTIGTIEDRDLIANECTGTLRWNGTGFVGFWGEACGTFSKELIRVDASALTVFSSTWQDKPEQATTSAF